MKCKANLILHKVKAQSRKVKDTKAKTRYQMTNSHASDTWLEDGDWGTTFYLKLHICSYLICAMTDKYGVSYKPYPRLTNKIGYT